jgi:hypothetical protein
MGLVGRFPSNFVSESDASMHDDSLDDNTTLETSYTVIDLVGCSIEKVI